MASPAAIEAAKELKGDCGNADNQAVMNACFEAEYAKADADLHAKYEHYLKVLSGPTRTDLITAQVAWLKYRDAECKAHADLELGGSIQPTEYYSCMVELSRAREKELDTDFSEP